MTWNAIILEKNLNANIGIQTGIKSGLVVIDIDPRNGGDKSLQNLVDSYDDVNAALDTHTVKTGGNGTHYYFSIDEPFKSIKKHGLGDGIDIQADGKYIVAPPSNHVSGGDYAVIKDINPKQLTKILIDLIGQQSAIEKKIDDVVEGGRNNWLAEIAGKALRDGKPANSLSQYLQEQNALRCKPPLDYTEVEAVVQSIIAGYDPSTSAVSFKTRWQELIIESNQKPIFKISCLALSTWMDKDGANCYPTIEQVANKCRMDRKTIGKHFDEAEKLGFFVRYSHSTPSKKGFNYGYVAKAPP